MSRAFDADPLTLTNVEVETHLVIELRRRRNAFVAKEAADRLKPKRSTTASAPQSAADAAKLDKPASEISISELFGDD
jgi:hypothetical protein